MWLSFHSIRAVKSRTQAIILSLVAVAAQATSQTAPPSQQRVSPSVSDIALNYTNYQRITKSVVFVNPELAMLCRGASKQEVDATRSKFGPHGNTGILI